MTPASAAVSCDASQQCLSAKATKHDGISLCIFAAREVSNTSHFRHNAPDCLLPPSGSFIGRPATSVLASRADLAQASDFGRK